MSKLPWQEIFSFSAKDLVQVVITALVILFVTKIQEFSDRLSAFFIALPLASLIAMLWMRAEHQSPDRIANHAEATFWYVLPTLPMFLILPWMLRHGWGFWPALGANCGITVLCFMLVVSVVRPLGVELWPK